MTAAYPYLLACGHTVEVPAGGSAQCPTCGPLAEYLDGQIARSKAAEEARPTLPHQPIPVTKGSTMSHPTPEEFLSWTEPEDEALPESAEGPHKVVESGTTLEPDFPADPGAVIPNPDALWQIPPTDLTGYVAQIAADVRALANELAPRGRLETIKPEEPTITETDSVFQQRRQDADRAYAEAPPLFDQTSQPYVEQIADLEDKNRVLEEFVGAIAAIVKPSSSKVSLEVKAAIEAYYNPKVEELAPDVEPAADGGGYPIETPQEAALGSVLSTGKADLGDGVTVDFTQPAAPVQPEHGAPVEEWRAYAKHMRPDASWADANRSQIRTALGIEQPT